jgi:hypothetical protein
VLRAAMVSTPLYHEVDEQHRPSLEILFRCALTTAIDAARQMFGKPRRTEEEAA